MKIARADSNHLSAMIADAMAAPLLDEEEERRLAILWREQEDEKALARLINAHRRMAVSAAIKFKGYGLPLSDLIQEGVIGLLEAAKRFDTSKEVRFCTYAGWWIRASMQDYILRNWSLVRIGSKSSHKTIFFNQSRIKKLIEETDQPDGLAEIARQFRVSEEDLTFMRGRLSGRDASLQAPITEDGPGERIDFLPDEAALPDETVGAQIDSQKRSVWIGQAMSALSERERHIIQDRFLDEKKQTLSSIGQKLRLSKERVRQIEKQAIEKLRKSLTESDRTGFLIN